MTGSHSRHWGFLILFLVLWNETSSQLISNNIIHNGQRRPIDNSVISNFSHTSLNSLYNYALELQQMLTAVQYQIALQQHKDVQNFHLPIDPPTNKDQQTINNQLQPITDQLQPITEQLQPITEQLHPINNELQPITEQLHPINNELQPITEQLQPITDQLQPIAAQNGKREKRSLELLNFLFENRTEHENITDLDFADEESSNGTLLEILKAVDRKLNILKAKAAPFIELSLDSESNETSSTTSEWTDDQATEEVDTSAQTRSSTTTTARYEAWRSRRFSISSVRMTTPKSTTTTAETHFEQNHSEITKPTNNEPDLSTFKMETEPKIENEGESAEEGNFAVYDSSETVTSKRPRPLAYTDETDNTSTSPNSTESSTTLLSPSSSPTTTSIATSSPDGDPSEPSTTLDPCVQLTQDQLVNELKAQGTYNPDLMAWDVPGVIRFLENSASNRYSADKSSEREDQTDARAVEKNLNSLERLLRELHVDCDVREPAVVARLYNLTINNKQTSSKHAQWQHWRFRARDQVVGGFANRQKDDVDGLIRDMDKEQTQREKDESSIQTQKHDLGQVHVVPYGCTARGHSEEGYLRLCAACQAIRRLPDDFFPPFINEVTCDQDKACLYFYDYPHGKCKQKYINFVVLRNLGTRQCQLWRKYNLSVRVSCECFVDEMSFFAKYV